QVREFLRRRIKHSALVVRADDEDTQVASVRRLDGRPVEVVDEIPVDVEVIEYVAVDRLQNDVRRGVSGKTDMADEAVPLQPARGGHAAVFPQRPFQKLPVIDAM